MTLPPAGWFVLAWVLAVVLAIVLAAIMAGRRPARTEPERLERDTRRLALGLTAGFLGIGGGLVWWQVFAARPLRDRPDNPRILATALRQVRGLILDRTGQPLVTNRIAADGIVQRVYAQPPLVHVTGFLNPRLGPSGLERAANEALTGREAGTGTERWLDRLLHRQRPGDDVVTTIDATIQQRAVTAFGTSARGGLVLLDPRNGDVLALVSRPWFDPNELTYDLERGTFAQEAARAQAVWDRLLADPSRPLVDRMLQGQYAPGSTFKTVTLAAALDSGVARPDDRFRFVLLPPDREHRVAWHRNQFVTCQNHPQLADLSLAEAYAWSCNVVFADLASALGGQRLATYARRFGFGQPVPFDLPTAAARLTTDPEYFRGPEGAYGVAATGIGQGQLAVTPIQMALVAAAIARGGIVPRPRLLREVRDPAGPVIRSWPRQDTDVAVSVATADRVTEIMVQAVENGWAQGARIPGFQVAGKTGTAQLGEASNPHSWFIGFAPAGNPRLAIAVIMENSGFGSEQAAPVARAVFTEALRQYPA